MCKIINWKKKNSISKAIEMQEESNEELHTPIENVNEGVENLLEAKDKSIMNSIPKFIEVTEEEYKKLSSPSLGKNDDIEELSKAIQKGIEGTKKR